MYSAGGLNKPIFSCPLILLSLPISILPIFFYKTLKHETKLGSFEFQNAGGLFAFLKLRYFLFPTHYGNSKN